MFDELILSHEHNSQEPAAHLFVDRDVRNSKTVGFYPWVEAALGVPRNLLNDWTARIADMKWFEDRIIQGCLEEYCKANEQYSRYAPFTHLVNHILTLAQGSLPGISDTNSYPIDSIQFVDTSSHLVSGIAERRHLSPACQLHVTLTNGRAAQCLHQGGTIEWADVLHWVELTYVNDLRGALEHEKASRKVSTSITTDM